MANLPLSPFIIDPDRRFALDEARFMAELEPPPAFLQSPRPEYLQATLQATEIMPIVEVLGNYFGAPRAA